jgi:phage terminase small subunit
MNLTPKQSVFINEYLTDLNATQAAIRAGYSHKTAAVIGLENLRKPLITDAITKAQAERSKRTEITQDSVLLDISAIKKNAMQMIVDKDGNQAMLDKNAALKSCELLGKHLGIFTDRFQVTTTAISIENLLIDL